MSKLHYGLFIVYVVLYILLGGICVGSGEILGNLNVSNNISSDYFCFFGGCINSFGDFLKNNTDFLSKNLFVGSVAETILNGLFVLGGDDAFINGMLGVSDDVFLDSDLYVLGNIYVTSVNETFLRSLSGSFCNNLSGLCVNISEGNINFSGNIYGDASGLYNAVKDTNVSWVIRNEINPTNDSINIRSSPWDKGVGIIFNDTAKIGIGLNNPSEKLVVNGTAFFPKNNKIIFGNGNNNRNVSVYLSGFNAESFFFAGNDPSFNFDASTNSRRMSFNPSLWSFDSGDTSGNWNGKLEFNRLSNGNVVFARGGGNVIIGSDGGGSSSRFVVNGSVAIGQNYVIATAPSNGLIVQGNVSIGTSLVDSALKVAGNINFSGNIFGDASGLYNAVKDINVSWIIKNEINPTNATINFPPSPTNLTINIRPSPWEKGAGIIYNDTTNVKVGIGTSTPTVSLDVSGRGKFSQGLINETITGACPVGTSGSSCASLFDNIDPYGRTYTCFDCIDLGTGTIVGCSNTLTSRICSCLTS